MNPFKAIKSAIGRRAVRSAIVQHYLFKLGKRPNAFTLVLDGAATSESSMKRVIDHNAAVARIMRSPKTFEKLLTAVSKNPEMLFRLLSQRGLRSQLRAQKNFLKSISYDQVALKHVLAGIPSANRGEIIRELVEKDANILRELNESTDFLAAALLERESYPDIAGRELGKNEERLLDILVALMDDKAPEIITKIATSNPHLFHKGPLRLLAVRSAGSDISSLSDMVALFATVPANGDTSGERLNDLMKEIFHQPIVMQAMIHDKNLRNTLFVALEDSAAAAGTDINEMHANRMRKQKT